MNWYKQAQPENIDLQNFLKAREKTNGILGFDFTDTDRDEAIRQFNRKIVSEGIKEKNITIHLYRNFAADMKEIDKDGKGNLILSPRKCESGVLWFAHDLQRTPEQYYDRGEKYLLTYPLEILSHYKETVYDDGNSQTWPITGDDPINEDSNKWMGYELPEGFKFSYKVQKHIICEKELIVPQTYITEINNELV